MDPRRGEELRLGERRAEAGASNPVDSVKMPASENVSDATELLLLLPLVVTPSPTSECRLGPVVFAFKLLAIAHTRSVHLSLSGRVLPLHYSKSSALVRCQVDRRNFGKIEARVVNENSCTGNSAGTR